MTLVVANKNITKHFILWIKKRMLNHLTTRLDMAKLTPYDEYFNSDEFKLLSNNENVSSRKIILFGMCNLLHKRYEANTHIFINPNICYPGTNLKIADLCKLINYGTMSLDSYPIFTETFDHFSKNINKYIDKYIIGLG